jgi:hypothetical protein
MELDTSRQADPSPSTTLNYATGELRETHRVETWIIRVCWCAPFLPHFLMYITWLAAIVTLGHPPRPSQDDPLQISSVVSLLCAATYLSVFTFILWAPIALILCFGLTIKHNDRKVPSAGVRNDFGWMSTALIWVGLLVFSGILFFSDPFRVLHWLLD